MSYLILGNMGSAWMPKNGYSAECLRQTRRIMVALVVSLCLAFLFLSIWNLIHSLPDTERHSVILNPRQPLLRTTSTMFLSFGLDSSLLRRMKDLPISDEKFINLAGHLSPAYLRIGGNAANSLFFNETSSNKDKSHLIGSPDTEDISNFTISGKDFLSLYQFTEKSGIRMLFDLNVLLRNPNGSWNDFNARQIIEFAKSHEMKLDWQLGNEPNSCHHTFGIEVTALQLAKDYNNLRFLLNLLGYEKSILVGPEVNHIGDPDECQTQRGENYIKEFLENDYDSIDFVTWHQYYLSDREGQIHDFINPEVFNKLKNQIKSLQDVINSVGKNTRMWLSETGSGGAPELSDRFVAGFLFLDKLGYSARTGVQVVIRQSFFGGKCAMVGPDLTPNPDWWISVVYKEFVSNKVLNLVTQNNFASVRLYAHCTPEKSLLNRVAAVTIYGLNLFEYSVKLLIEGTGLTSKNPIFLYALTADKLQSRTIKMNGEVLKLLPNGNLPAFKPVILETEDFITLPAYSMIFIVMHGVNISACSL